MFFHLRHSFPLHRPKKWLTCGFICQHRETLHLVSWILETAPDRGLKTARNRTTEIECLVFRTRVTNFGSPARIKLLPPINDYQVLYVRCVQSLYLTTVLTWSIQATIETSFASPRRCTDKRVGDSFKPAPAANSSNRTRNWNTRSKEKKHRNATTAV